MNQPRTVSQLKGRPFYGQAKGQLWLTRRPYAGSSQWLYPLWCLRHHLCHGVKRVTGFSGHCVPLQIQFPCHRRKHVTGFSGHCVPLQIQFLCHPAERWDYNPPRNNHLISISRRRAARISPSGEDAAAGGRRGAFPAPVRAVGLFSIARQGGCLVFSYWRPFFFKGAYRHPERSDATLLHNLPANAGHNLPLQRRCRPLSDSEHNPWHRGPTGPMDAIRPSAPKAQAPSGIQPARLHFITQKEQAQSLLFSFGIYPRKYFTPASKRGWYLFPQIFFPIFSPRRSVWPILPRTLPSGLVMPSTAQQEPLGLKRLS